MRGRQHEEQGARDSGSWRIVVDATVPVRETATRPRTRRGQTSRAASGPSWPVMGPSGGNEFNTRRVGSLAGVERRPHRVAYKALLIGASRATSVPAGISATGASVR